MRIEGLTGSLPGCCRRPGHHVGSVCAPRDLQFGNERAGLVRHGGRWRPGGAEDETFSGRRWSSRCFNEAVPRGQLAGGIVIPATGWARSPWESADGRLLRRASGAALRALLVSGAVRDRAAWDVPELFRFGCSGWARPRLVPRPRLVRAGSVRPAARSRGRIARRPGRRRVRMPLWLVVPSTRPRVSC